MKAIVVVIACVAVAHAGLLRVPKVYNALITTKEKLVPSRAFSVSAPVFQPIGLTPALPVFPIAALPEPEGAEEDTTPPALESAEPAAPEKTGSEDEPDKKTNATTKTTLHPIVPPIALPVAYYNSLTYYHSLWPHTYSALSPAYVFTAPFAYPGIVGDFYSPLLPGKKPGKEAAGKSAESPDLPEGAQVDAENDSVSVESS